MQVYPVTQVPSGLPPSPTLTNPDMILPFDLPQSPISRDAGSPVTSGEDERRARSSMKDPQSRLRHAKQNLSPFRNGVLTSHDGSLTRSNSDRQHGRIKVENSRLTFRPNGDESKPMPGSPLVDNDSREMHTVPEGSEEDEEVTGMHNSYKAPSILDEDENDPESHAAMTKRAEEILANAKKRLNNMEGNLTRARSTLGSRPSSSMSAFADREPPYKREKVSRLKHRQGQLTLKDDHQGHSRVFSETSVPSSLQSPTKVNGNVNPIDEHPEPARNWFWNGIGRSGGGSDRNNRGLQRLDEDDTIDSFERQQAAEESSNGKPANIGTDPILNTDQPQLSPTYGLTRSRSTNQMRDLRDQMTDLKGKITSLRLKAREDSLKRRSLQSLRTPSPLNNAEQDYSKIPLNGGQDRGPEIPFNIEQQELKLSSRNGQSETTPSLQAPIPIKEPKVENIQSPDVIDSAISMTSPTTSVPANDVTTAPRDVFDATPSFKSSNFAPTSTREVSQTHVNGITESAQLQQKEMVIAQPQEKPEIAGDEQDAESVAELEEQVGERHEDRADAFDYEHFFLASSMGHYGRKRGSTHSSDYSVETERPPTMVLDTSIEEADEKEESPTRHVRQPSNSSVSSLATFATATEGEESEASEEKEWTPRHTMAGTWLVDGPMTEMNGGGKTPSKVGTRKTLDTKQEMSVKRHRREHSVTDEGVNAPVPEAPDLIAYLKAVLSKEAGTAVDLTLNDSDRELAERVVKSLANVCLDLQTFSKDGARYEARVCRRRIDTARRHLDGEVNGEAF